MVPVLNNLKTDAACLGNHDLDFGIDRFEYLARQCGFPWLCANVLDPALGQDVPLGKCQRTAIIISSNGVKVGLIGLVEQEWLDTINFLPPDLDYRSPSSTAMELAPRLREQGADIVIVLAHQRMANDVALAQQIEPGTVDIILGGHDHTYEFERVNGTAVLRSGSDFKQFSYIEARRRAVGTGWDFHIVRRDVVSAIPQDTDTVATMSKITAAVSDKLEKPVGYVAAPLDARFTTVRVAESNVANLMCDLMRLHYGADCSLICGGTVRGDQVYPPGVLRLKDIVDCFPFEDACVVVTLTGEALVEALENGVSKWPSLDGRFPQVSGIIFAFDPSKVPGQRCCEVEVNGRSVNLLKEYSMATRDYMCHGKDGYHMLQPVEQGGRARVTVPDESGLLLSMLLRQYFMSLKVLGRWRNWTRQMGEHWEGIHRELHEKHPSRAPQAKAGPDGEPADHAPKARVATSSSRTTHGRNGHHRAKPNDSFDLSNSEDESLDHSALPSSKHRAKQEERRLVLARKAARKWWRLAGLSGHPALVEEAGEVFGAYWTRAVAPKVEGRIRQIVAR